MAIHQDTADVVHQDTADVIHQDSFHQNLASVAGELPALEISAGGGGSSESTLPALSVEAGSGATCESVLPDLQLYTREYIFGRSYSRLPDLQVTITQDTSIRAGLDPREEYWPKLPELRIDAETGERGNASGRFPALDVEARSGGKLRAGKLPALEIESVGSKDISGTATAKLPPMEVSSRTGAVSNILKFPALETEAVGSRLTAGTMTRKLPPLGIEAVSNSLRGTSSLTFPALEIVSSGQAQNKGELIKSLPGLKIVSAMTADNTGQSELTLPELRILAESNSVLGRAEAILPALMVSQSSGGDFGNSMVSASNKDRFKDFSPIRHQRWVS